MLEMDKMHATVVSSLKMNNGIVYRLRKAELKQENEKKNKQNR